MHRGLPWARTSALAALAALAPHVHALPALSPLTTCRTHSLQRSLCCCPHALLLSARTLLLSARSLLLSARSLLLSARSLHALTHPLSEPVRVESTRLRPHCGSTNRKLNLHVGLRVPLAGAARLRLGEPLALSTARASGGDGGGGDGGGRDGGGGKGGAGQGTRQGEE